MKIKLGDKVKDKLTDLEGTAITICLVDIDGSRKDVKFADK